MSDFPLIAITDANSCPRSLTEQLLRLKQAPIAPAALILRAKTLSRADYQPLAKQVQKICTEQNLPLILHSDWQLANALGIDRLHLPPALLQSLPEAEKKRFRWLSTSVHSIEEAQQAQALGANVLIAGHIYATQCKAGLAPRGLGFLQAICQSTRLPVYAIGGIGFNTAQLAELQANGACGACVMSAYMQV